MPKIAAFPKCYIDQIAGDRTMSVFDWIEQARSLDADGLEMYDGFFTSLEPAYLDRVGEAIAAAGFAMPMLCCSPDFTESRRRRPQACRRSPGDADRRGQAARRSAARSAGSSPVSAIPKSTAARGWNGLRTASIRRSPSRVSTTSSSGWKTTTRTASGSIPNSPRRWTSSSSCSR